MLEKLFYVYILTNMPYGVFYVGVTSDLIKRIYEHKQKYVEGFSKRYNTTLLVYYEVFNDAETAIKREKRLKRWPREWKINAIHQFNPDWCDLYESVAAL
jgi:putative endonuclease